MTEPLRGMLIGPAPITGMTWHIRLHTPYEGHEEAVMTNDTRGISTMRQRLGGTLSLGDEIIVVDLKLKSDLGETEIHILEVA